MNPLEPIVTRRGLMRGGLALGALSLFTPGAFADELSRTPRVTEGPFYPDRLPLDTDNDLLIVNNSITPAVGEITHLSGRVLSTSGEPVRGVTVEIWQVDGRGVYLHSNDSGRRQRDTNFQGFGRCATSRKGEYYFRTIKPVPYPGRTPHIHVKVRISGRPEFITQCYVRGEQRNNNDGILQGIRDQRQRDSVIIEFAPIPNSRINELAARFDVILGFTPETPPAGDKDKKKK